MKNIKDIDKNFNIETKIERQDLRFYNAESEPFRIYGLMKEDGRFCRMPESVAAMVNDGVHYLYAHTAGGRLRFVTDSPYVVISAELDLISRNSDFPLSGTAGFDMYADEGNGQIYVGTFTPPMDMENSYESVLDFADDKKRIITINFPPYSNVKTLHIGLKDGSPLERAPDYRLEIPIVYYGSSITQGGCVSRPGNTYQAIISRKLDCNFLNLGFSGSASGGEVISDYISSLDMSAFVMDYDHNSPSVEHLKATHEPMFKRIRENHPDLPIVIMSRPKFHLTSEEAERKAVIEATYKNAKKAGDENVYFIAGDELILEEMRETATVDNVHPNDSGFLSIAKVLGDVLDDIFLL